MEPPGEPSRQLEVLTKRIAVLRRLCEKPAHKRDLVADLDKSRSTIDRSIRELAELNFVERCDDGVTATPAGCLAVEHLGTFQAGLADIVTAEAVLNPLGSDTAVTTDVVAGSEVLLATDPVPYRPLEGVHNALAAADRYRLVLPALDDPRHVRLLYEHVVTESSPAELLVTPALLGTLREEFPRRLAAMAEEPGFELLVVEELPPFALCLADSDVETTVSVVVFGDSGTVHGVLRNDSPDAQRWATDRYETLRASASEQTDGLLTGEAETAAAPDPDGGVAAIGTALSVPLEREGLVRLDTGYFRDEPVAHPTTAWRAGLSLAEVHTGYAVERVDRTGADMAEQLATTLGAGTDCLLVGSPGAGKSTLCKRVACGWYDDERGPVLYREQGRGRPFDAVEDLVVTVDAAEGHTLVVVEDAVRPEANAVFEAIERLADRDDVSFLLDARENEWLDPPEQFDASADLAVTTVPELDEQDCARLIDHFERTVGEDVDVPAGQLWAEVRTEIEAEETTASGMLLLLHRLSTYADPLSDGQTRMEEAVEELAADLADDEIARDVCLLANTLNAAGLAVDRDALYAVADPDEFEAVDAALDRLEGRVLFAPRDGRYRTVHESWSVAYFAATLEQEPDAADQFGTVVTALLALAEDGSRRDRIRDHVADTPTLAAIQADPAGWTAETVKAVYALGRDRPKVAWLFGDGRTDSISLPAVCPDATAQQVPVWLGRMFRRGGYFDAATRAFERLPDTYAIERLLGLAWIATETGNYDEAIELTERCLTELDDDRSLAKARANLIRGRVHTYRGAYDDARAQLRTTLDGFEAEGDRRRTARTLGELGRAAREQGDYEAAREFHERSLRISRELGDRTGEASSFTALGTAAFGLGEYDQAREHFERSLDIARTRGDRVAVLNSLKWLGNVALYRSEYDRAKEYFERALATARKVGDPHMEAEILGTRGLLAERLGNYEQAERYLEDGLDLAAEIGDSRSIAARHNNLGLVAVRLAEHDRARDEFRAGLEIAREHGHRRHEANGLNGLGHVARMRGEYERAREHAEEALTVTREIDNKRRIADSHNKLGLVALRRGEPDRAEMCFRSALAVAEELDHPREEAKSLKGLGEAARMRGEYEQASEHIEQARERIEATGTKIETAHARLAAARLALSREAYDEARTLAAEVCKSTTEMGATQWAARADRLLGRIAAAEGDDEAAREHWTRTLERLTEVDAPQDELATLRLLVEQAEERGDEEAAECWRERIEERVADAPEAAVEQHDEWLSEQLE